MSRKQKNENSSKMNSKRIVALSGVVLLALLYLVTLVVAIVDNSASGSLIKLCLFGTVAIPILIWIYTWMYGKLTGRDTIADFDHKADKNAD